MKKISYKEQQKHKPLTELEDFKEEDNMSEEHCTFDWKEFHAKLDIASAHIINDTKNIPSEISLLDLMEYSHKKMKGGTCKEAN